MSGGYEKRAVPAMWAFITAWVWSLVKRDAKPPLAPGIALRTRRATANHHLMALVLGYLAAVATYRQRLLNWFDEQLTVGHMTNEFMSASHWQHYLGPVAAALIHALRQGHKDVADAAVEWLAIQLALCRRFYEPGVRKGSVVAPGARGWGGWKKGSVPSSEQHSWLRDEWVRYADHGKPFKGAYSPGLDAECVALLTHPDMPYQRIREAADRVDLDAVRVVAPICEARLKSNTVRWWSPPRQVTATRPTVYMAAVLGRADAYSCEPYEPDERERAAAVRIGRAG